MKAGTRRTVRTHESEGSSSYRASSEKEESSECNFWMIQRSVYAESFTLQQWKSHQNMIKSSGDTKGNLFSKSLRYLVATNPT